MIVAAQKPFAEILAAAAPYRRLLIAACGGCVTVCLSGGEAEAEALRLKLELAGKNCVCVTPQRQCDAEFLAPLDEQAQQAEAILSLGCGAGTQFMAERWPHKPLLPAQNTSFLGVNRALGEWTEMCQGCGDCLLTQTAGICPIARCAKSNYNGPCGGSMNGKCEISADTDCAWQLIYDRLLLQHKLDDIRRVTPPRDWSGARDGGPRRMLRPDLRLEDADDE